MQPVSSDNADDPDENQPLLTQAHAMETVSLGSRRYSGLSDSSGASPSTRERSATTADAHEASAAAGNGDVAVNVLLPRMQTCQQRITMEGDLFTSAVQKVERCLRGRLQLVCALDFCAVCSHFTTFVCFQSSVCDFRFCMLSLLSRVHQRSSGSCLMDA